MFLFFVYTTLCFANSPGQEKVSTENTKLAEAFKSLDDRNFQKGYEIFLRVQNGVDAIYDCCAIDEEQALEALAYVLNSRFAQAGPMITPVALQDLQNTKLKGDSSPRVVAFANRIMAGFSLRVLQAELDPKKAKNVLKLAKKLSKNIKNESKFKERLVSEFVGVMLEDLGQDLTAEQEREFYEQVHTNMRSANQRKAYELLYREDLAPKHNGPKLVCSHSDLIDSVNLAIQPFFDSAYKALKYCDSVPTVFWVFHCLLPLFQHGSQTFLDAGQPIYLRDFLLKADDIMPQACKMLVVEHSSILDHISPELAIPARARYHAVERCLPLLLATVGYDLSSTVEQKEHIQRAMVHLVSWLRDVLQSLQMPNIYGFSDCIQTAILDGSPSVRVMLVRAILWEYALKKASLELARAYGSRDEAQVLCLLRALLVQRLGGGQNIFLPMTQALKLFQVECTLAQDTCYMLPDTRELDTVIEEQIAEDMKKVAAVSGLIGAEAQVDDFLIACDHAILNYKSLPRFMESVWEAMTRWSHGDSEAWEELDYAIALMQFTLPLPKEMPTFLVNIQTVEDWRASKGRLRNYLLAYLLAQNDRPLTQDELSSTLAYSGQMILDYVQENYISNFSVKSVNKLKEVLERGLYV